MIPVGLADLGRVPTLVGARLLRRSAGRILLADALRQLEARDETMQAADDCQAGDFVAALVLTEPASGEAVCRSLSRLGQGATSAEPTSARPLLLRQAAEAALREYFRDQRFLEVRTPTFGVCPGLDPHVQALGSVSGLRGQEYLMTSPEFFMKRLLTAGVPRLFELGAVFRAEELGPWHEPEFTLLEWYRAYEGLESILTDTEQLVCRVSEALRAAGAPSAGTRPLRLERPFLRMTLREAFRQYADIADASDYAATNPSAYFQTFVDRIEPRLAELPGPVFLTEFPASQAALARLSPTDPSVALRFELTMFGIELCNGYDELTDPREQRSRFECELNRRGLAGEPSYPLDERFLGALELGMPPAAGNALGFERLLAVLSGAANIEPFYAFPASSH
jgi:lysyl-tRNA synthetase class 2